MSKGFIKQQIAIWKWKRSTIGQALVMHTRTYFYEQTALSDFRQENKDRLILDFYNKVFAIAQSPNGFIELREALAEYVLAFAQLQVLCLKETAAVAVADAAGQAVPEFLAVELGEDANPQVCSHSRSLGRTRPPLPGAWS